MSNAAKNLNPQIKLRKAMESDLSGVLELYHHLHQNEPILEQEERIYKIWDQIISDPRLTCFVADNDGVLASTCMLDIVPNLTRFARPFGVLQNVVTREDQRGLGIGGALNAYALEYAWSMNCYQVLVQTDRDRVIAFYERLGFKKDKVGLVAKPEWQKPNS